MRLYPAAWITSRQAAGPDHFDGLPVATGSKLFINIWGMHRHPDHWEQPDAFFPEHFTPDHVARRHKFAFIPFGAGPRKCIGEQFAMAEAQLVLATLFPMASLKLRPGFVPAPETEFTLQAKDGMPMYVSMR